MKAQHEYRRYVDFCDSLIRNERRAIGLSLGISIGLIAIGIVLVVLGIRVSGNLFQETASAVVQAALGVVSSSGSVILLKETTRRSGRVTSLQFVRAQLLEMTALSADERRRVVSLIQSLLQAELTGDGVLK